MSRYEVRHYDKGLAFGKDHAIGEFLQIWKRPDDAEERRKQDLFGPDPEEMLVDMDTMFDQDFTHEKMLELIKEHGFEEYELEKIWRSRNSDG